MRGAEGDGGSEIWPNGVVIRVGVKRVQGQNGMGGVSRIFLGKDEPPDPTEMQSKC